jgi:hypothetical protein
MEDNKKEIKTYLESFLMYEKTKKETFEKMSEAMNPDGSKRFSEKDVEKQISMIQMMQDDIKNKYLFAGGDPNELILKQEKIEKKSQKRKVVPKTTTKTTFENEKNVVNKIEKKEPIEIKKNTSIITNEIPVVPTNWNISDFTESFDVIPLPSKGECYDNNMSTIAVSYLTANDENMIVAPNLYRDGLILDYLLKAKIKNKDINPDDLLEGDREAIILWLRATGYGIQYPVTVTDNKTGVNFDTVVDLTQIKHKPFVLKGDGNGNFDYTLPISQDEIKFRFLTHGDIKQIEQIEKEEQPNIKKEHLKRIVEDLSNYIETDDVLSKDEKTKLYEAKRNINKWYEKIETDNDMGYTHMLTNRLELSIVSINGNYNREYISNYVQNMNVQDALAIRRYINENEPGLDYTVTVERPESLGGGSMPIFLSLDEYIFLNIA